MDLKDLLSAAKAGGNSHFRDSRSTEFYFSTASSPYPPSFNPATTIATAAGAAATASSASSPATYDGTGAMCYTLVIVLLFGLGIMLLIATQVSYHHQETAVGKYMKEIELVRENIVRAGKAGYVLRPPQRVSTASSLLDRAFVA